MDSVVTLSMNWLLFAPGGFWWHRMLLANAVRINCSLPCTHYSSFHRGALYSLCNSDVFLPLADFLTRQVSSLAVMAPQVLPTWVQLFPKLLVHMCSLQISPLKWTSQILNFIRQPGSVWLRALHSWWTKVTAEPQPAPASSGSRPLGSAL